MLHSSFSFVYSECISEAWSFGFYVLVRDEFIFGGMVLFGDFVFWILHLTRSAEFDLLVARAFVECVVGFIQGHLPLAGDN